ncbi:golgin IMH1-like [Bombus terrestris]|uniref:Golgin IMH1-like n=1 Tax=Bombus terrestris TaxID=30195 RepID=A0A9B7CVE0_BOMTE|nr:golgin IMH1-like [Bombus terrestris]
MKQMRNWRDDRMKLRSNIWRLKLALRVAARDTDDTLHAVRLIEHQKTEIKRLETVNKDLKKEIADIKSALLDGDYVTRETAWKSDDKAVEVKQEYLIERERLNNEIQYLKSRLKEVEGGHEHNSEVEHLKCKLKHFMMVDYTMEIIFTDIVNKVAETIANLSEELVNVNDRLHKSQMKNDNLYVEIDKLKAVIRYRNGNLTDYRKRIVELDNLTKCLKTELNRFKVNDGNNSWNIDSNSHNNLNNIERLAKDLRNKLKNDHEVLLAGGDPDYLKYIQKIIELSVNLKQLHIGFAKFSNQLNPLSLGKVMKSNEYLKQLATLDSTLKEIDIEIDKLKNNHIKNHYRIGGSDGLEYLIKIEELETIIEKTRSTMNGLNRRAEGNSNKSKDLEELENFVGRVCHQIKQLEVIVVSSDRLNTFKRIDQLKGLIVRLKSELNEKDAHINVLDQELFGTENLLEQKRKELQHTQKKIVMLMEENKISKLRIKMMEEKALELQRDQEDSRKELVQLQKVEREASLTRKKLQNLQSDKERLLKEMGKIRDAVQKKSEEARSVLIERNTMEKALNAKITDLTRNIQITLKENKKLKENENAKRSEEAIEKMNAELQQLKVDLAISNENFDNANREIADLKIKLYHFSDAKTRLETNIFHLESKKEVLVYQLGAEKATADERLKEFTNLKSDYNELDIKRANLEKEKEQLNVNLTNIKIEKELLEKSVNHVRTKCTMLEDKIDKYKCERNSLLEEIRNFRTSNEHLSNKLEVTQTESNRIGDKIKQLEFENSKLHDDLNGLTLKKINFENRVQTLLLEKNQLATRINELDKNSVTLNDLLNQVKTVNEQNSIVELNKLKADYSKMRSENMSLQTTLDEVRQNNETLRKATEELNLRLNEIHSECKILENQLQILEVMNATLKKEKQLLEQKYTTSLRSKISNIEKEETVVYSKSIFSQQNEQMHVERATRKAFNSKSGKRLNDKIKLMEAKEELKKVIVENESLRFEVLNLRSQNFEVKMQLACTKDELRKQKTELVENETNEIVFKPTSNKLEIVNFYYKEINSYLSHDMNNVKAVTRIGQSSICPYDRSTTEQAGTQIEKLMEIANKLKVQNIALKMEINSLRCSLVVNFTKDEKRKEELRIATEEIQALKTELTTLRDEKESLRVRLDTANSKLDRLESEKTALKNELCAIRKINSGLKHKTSELHCAYQKLKEKSVEFESCMMRAINKIKRYTMSADNLDNPNDLKDLLKKYISSEEILYSIEQKINIEDTYKNFEMM